MTYLAMGVSMVLAACGGGVATGNPAQGAGGGGNSSFSTSSGIFSATLPSGSELAGLPTGFNQSISNFRTVNENGALSTSFPTTQAIYTGTAGLEVGGGSSFISGDVQFIANFVSGLKSINGAVTNMQLHEGGTTRGLGGSINLNNFGFNGATYTSQMFGTASDGANTMAVLGTANGAFVGTGATDTIGTVNGTISGNTGQQSLGGVYHARR